MEPQPTETQPPAQSLLSAATATPAVAAVQPAAAPAPQPVVSVAAQPASPVPTPATQAAPQQPAPLAAPVQTPAVQTPAVASAPIVPAPPVQQPVLAAPPQFINPAMHAGMMPPYFYGLCDCISAPHSRCHFAWPLQACNQVCSPVFLLDLTAPHPRPLGPNHTCLAAATWVSPTM